MMQERFVFKGRFYRTSVCGNCYKLLAMKTSNASVTEFVAYDEVRSEIDNLNLECGDPIVITWYKSTYRGKENKKMSSITKPYNLPKEKKEVILGVIKNTNNSRGYGKTKEEVAFTVKDLRKDNNLLYCYAPKQITRSSWFKKDQSVKIEAISREKVNDHAAYDVITLWEN